ncbi:ABC transporter ATP-binding protein [Streptomyces sp. NPDC048521]|uniref:ABC transporter ATP-binding protein n=1 Tax=Streptomyces sp. NPDC048521 TaxID=3365566 RepID=UPI00371F37D7
MDTRGQARRFVRARWRVLVRLGAWSVLEAGQTFVVGYALARALDTGFLTGDARAGLLWLGAAGLAVAVGAYGTGRVYGVVAALVEPVRDRLATAVVARGVREADPGTLSGLTQQVEIARDALAGLVMVSRSFVITSAGALIGLFSLAPLLLAVVLPPLLAGVTLFAATLGPLARRQEAFLAADEALAGELGAVCPGLRDITSAGAEARVTVDTGERIDAELGAARALARWSVARVAALAVGGQSPVVLLLAATPWLLGHGVTPGALVGALAYVTQSLLPALHNLVHGLGTGGSRLTVVLRRLATPPAEQTPPPPTPAEPALPQPAPAQHLTPEQPPDTRPLPPPPLPPQPPPPQPPAPHPPARQPTTTPPPAGHPPIGQPPTENPPISQPPAGTRPAPPSPAPQPPARQPTTTPPPAENPPVAQSPARPSAGLRGAGVRLSAAGRVGADAVPGSGAPALALASVAFAYGPASEPVLDGLDLAVPVGGHLAVVGPSGIGKSTLTGLVAGLLRPVRGTIRVYGHAVPAPAAAALRVLIPQEAYVHGGTLAENLALFRPDPVPEAELLAAAEAVGLTPLLRTLGGPGGRVEPAALSAGERQLIALTRAYLSAAPLALLDEATCHLDPQAEARAERAFAARPGGTLVVVAHRISSARRADRILVMDGPRTSCGAHEELLRTSALYRNLVGGWATPRAPLPG